MPPFLHGAAKGWIPQPGMKFCLTNARQAMPLSLEGLSAIGYARTRSLLTQISFHSGSYSLLRCLMRLNALPARFQCIATLQIA